MADVRTVVLIAGITLASSAIAGPTAAAPASTASLCQAAGEVAERTYGVPPGMLVAIGRVESGRKHPQTGRIIPWPWTINAAGSGRMFERPEEVIDATQRLQEQGLQSIDVGCYQVNLQHHPNAFKSLAEAFDPRYNADYAARFLVSLHAKLKTWEEAIAAYHSSTPELGGPYRDRVLQGWAHGDVVGPAVSPLPPLPPVAGHWGPVTMQFGMQVWTPTQGGVAANVVAIRGGPFASPIRGSGQPQPFRVAHVIGGTSGWSGCAATMQQSALTSGLRKC